MAAEIAEQPRALQALLEYRRAIPAPPLSEIQQPRGVMLMARGSSDHAALYGRYLLEAALRVPVGLCAPSLWTRYRSHSRLDGYLAIGLSQSGQTPEIARVLDLAGRAGATTVAITNDAESPLADAADFVLDLGVGPEQAVPATKTFLAQLLALAVVAEALGEVPWSSSDPDRLPDALQELLDENVPMAQVAEELSQARAVIQVAGGFLYPVAQEGALKMIETASVPVLAYSAANLIHGPIAATGGAVPVVCYSSTGPMHADVTRVAAAAAARGAGVVWIGDAPPGEVRWQLPVRSVLPDALMPLLHVVRAQQLALALSRAVGLDADLPRGLSKVTVTS